MLNVSLFVDVIARCYIILSNLVKLLEMFFLTIPSIYNGVYLYYQVIVVLWPIHEFYSNSN